MRGLNSCSDSLLSVHKWEAKREENRKQKYGKENGRGRMINYIRRSQISSPFLGGGSFNLVLSFSCHVFLFPSSTASIGRFLLMIDVR